MIAILAMALAATPTWQELAPPDAALEAQLARLNDERRAQVVTVLEAMARCPFTAEGVRSAWTLVAEALPGMEKPGFAGSGEGPNRTALRSAAMKVLLASIAKTSATLKTKDELQALLAVLQALPKLKDEAREQLIDQAHTHFRG